MKDKTREAKIEVQVSLILQMRFGDGSGKPDRQIELATKELLALIQSEREGAMKGISLEELYIKYGTDWDKWRKEINVFLATLTKEKEDK